MSDKHYPDSHAVRDKTRSVCEALEALRRMNIEAREIQLTAAAPVIQVFHCPGNKALKASVVGHSDGAGGVQIKKAAWLRGCRVIWSEQAGLPQSMEAARWRS